MEKELVWLPKLPSLIVVLYCGDGGVKQSFLPLEQLGYGLIDRTPKRDAKEGGWCTGWEIFTFLLVSNSQDSKTWSGQERESSKV